ncbi:flagellar basal body protein [Methylosinus sp. Sm6]|uniref:flagellar basal body protein n=1 Tax=Methylosinus sp. Sm6 TaxID=2866948 RepID=UPI001C99A5BF|nr:flagellar basal body protein [Methylosinus sp. Sm6]MBY6242167.1 flagellar basal body protein [Methylosinus sp. Sm6]
MVEPVYLFDLVDRQRAYLTARQALVAQNIANANTPGYRAVDLAPFSKALDQSAMQLAETNSLHLQNAAFDPRSGDPQERTAWETTVSGNSVSLEQEMIKGGEIRGAFSVDTAILKAFHGMWMATLKG